MKLCFFLLIYHIYIQFLTTEAFLCNIWMECLVSLLKFFGLDPTARLFLHPGAASEPAKQQNKSTDTKGWFCYCMETGHCGGCDERRMLKKLLSSWLMLITLSATHGRDSKAPFPWNCSSSAMEGTIQAHSCHKTSQYSTCHIFLTEKILLQIPLWRHNNCSFIYYLSFFHKQ